MGIVKMSNKGNFNKTTNFLNNAKNMSVVPVLVKYGSEGVNALKNVTPVDTGKTAHSWYYRIHKNKDGSYELNFCNKNISDGAKVAVLIQYGHASQDGAWVKGTDYINPALQPIFDNIASNIWREVTGWAQR